MRDFIRLTSAPVKSPHCSDVHCTTASAVSDSGRTSPEVREVPNNGHGAGLLGLEVREQRLLVAVAEGRGVEIGGLVYVVRAFRTVGLAI
jgi:hypothetical protein